jgi:hypothetical protein
VRAESQIDDARYWLSFLRSSMSAVRRRNTGNSDEGDGVARVLLAVTHTDAVEPKHTPDGLLRLMVQLVDALGEAASDPPRLERCALCVPRYDHIVKADEARSSLIRSIEKQVVPTSTLSLACAVKPPDYDHNHGVCRRRSPVKRPSRSMSSPGT